MIRFIRFDSFDSCQISCVSWKARPTRVQYLSTVARLLSYKKAANKAKARRQIKSKEQRSAEENNKEEFENQHQTNKSTISKAKQHNNNTTSTHTKEHSIQ